MPEQQTNVQAYQDNSAVPQANTDSAIIQLNAQYGSTPESQFSRLDSLNLYMLTNQKVTGGKSDTYVVSSPGLTELCDLSGKCIRGIWFHYDLFYVVCDSSVYSVTRDGSSTLLGALSTSEGRVSIISNTTQIMISDGVYGYTYNTSTKTFAKISDLDFPTTAPKVLTYQDGYGLFTESVSNRAYASELNDFTSFNALDYTGIGSVPNKLQASISSHLELWLFTDVNAEIWSNSPTGASGFPFTRRPNLAIEYGLAAPYSLMSVKDTLVWLARTKYGSTFLVTANGYNPKILTSMAVNTEWDSYTSVDDAFAFAYEERGHIFYQITFPSVNKTWCVDLTTSAVFRKTSIDRKTNLWSRHRANCGATGFNLNVVGDYQSGKLYYFDHTNPYDGTDIIEREFTISTSTIKGQRVTLNSLQMDCEVGLGSSVTPIVDPQIMMQISKDSGKTWLAERWKSLGKIGEYTKRVIWYRFGSSRNWVAKFRVTDPVVPSFYQLFAQFDVGED